MSAHGHASGHSVHRNYVGIWGLLVVLLVISVVGPFAGIRLITLLTAFGVALVKAYLVAKNFMHLDVEKPIIHWLLAVILTLMVLLFSGVSPDVMKHRGRNWERIEVAQPADAGAHEAGDSGASHEAQGH